MAGKLGRKGLTILQKKFAEAYEGNGVEAARKAGYRGSDKVLAITANKNLKNPEIVKLIRGREERQLRPYIMTRLDRQRFWTKVALDKEQSMADRLRAVSDLAKSEGDFLTRIEVSDDLSDRMKEAERRLEQEEVAISSSDNLYLTNEEREEEGAW